MSRRVKLLLAFLAVAAFVAVRRSGVIPELDLQRLLEDIAATLGVWTYPTAALLAFLETGAFVGLVAPGETVVTIAGAVAGLGETQYLLTVAIVWVSAWAGDSASFALGRRVGRDVVLRHGGRVGVTRERFARVEDYVARHGGKTILIGRFLGVVRALAPFIAASSGMRYRHFLPYSVLGTGLWGGFYVSLGFLFASQLERVTELAGRGTFAFGVLVAVVVAAVWLRRVLSDPARRRALVKRIERAPGGPALLALGSGIRGPVSFAAGRLTPGGLGLELTSLVAVLAVGAFAFVAYAVAVGAEPGPLPEDERAADVAGQLGALEPAADAVTHLGDPVVVAVLLAAWLGWLAWRRRWAELAALAVGMAACALAVDLFKEAFDRPRPPAAPTPPAEAAFPSGHAAYSVLWIWVAGSAAVREPPGFASGGALVAGGVLVSAAVGLSRVQLGLHWLSDVVAGWGLALAVLSTAGTIALLVVQLRHNRSGRGL